MYIIFCVSQEAVLPQVYQSTLSLHAIWHTKLRLDLCSNPQSSRLSAVYVECEGEVRVLSGVRGGQGMVVSLAGSAGGSTNGSTRYLLNSLRHQVREQTIELTANQFIDVNYLRVCSLCVIVVFDLGTSVCT
jgi:hypothetical protein